MPGKPGLRGILWLAAGYVRMRAVAAA